MPDEIQEQSTEQLTSEAPAEGVAPAKPAPIPDQDEPEIQAE